MDNIPLLVLYVDDETTLLDLGKLFLERNKAIHVDIASSAHDALSLLACKSYDAIISDYQMPEIDGIELLKEVRRLFGDIPFILFTGRGREEVVIQAINHGADFYLQKGGEPKSQFVELEHKVRQAVTRRKAEHALRESERTSRALLDATTDAVALITGDLTILAVNEAFARRFNQESDQMTGKNLHEYIPPDLGRDRKARVHEVIATKKPVRFEDRRDELFLENSFYPIFDEQGEVFRLAMYSRDITNRKRAEDELHAAYEQIAASEESLKENYQELLTREHALRESESWFRGLFDQAFQLAGVLDLSGRITHVNQTALDLIGKDASGVKNVLFWETPWWNHDPEAQDKVKDAIRQAVQGELVRFETTHLDSTGKPVTEWTAPYDLERNSEEVKKCFQNGFIRGLEIDYLHPDGTMQPLEVNASVVGSESGDIILTL